MSNPVGRPADEWRRVVAERYGLSPKQARKLCQKLLHQIEICKTEDARRLILGVK